MPSDDIERFHGGACSALLRFSAASCLAIIVSVIAWKIPWVEWSWLLGGWAALPVTGLGLVLFVVWFAAIRTAIKAGYEVGPI